MFERVWGFLKGDKEGKQHQYPELPISATQVRALAMEMGVNDVTLAPNRREAARLMAIMKKEGGYSISRTVMVKGEQAVKVWRVR